jgi:hypothetical protein
VSIKKKLRAIFLCAALEVGVLAGVPMRPEEIRALMNQINQPTVAHILPSDDERGNDPLDNPPAWPPERCERRRQSSRWAAPRRIKLRPPE